MVIIISGTENVYVTLDFMENFVKMTHFRCLCVGGFSGTTCAINNGIQISDELTHSNTLQFGDWKGYKYCSHGYFVNGIQLRVDPAGGDDTALNNVRLECKRPYDNTTGTSVKSGTAQDGVWYGTSYCPDGMYMVAFVVRLLPYKGPFSDDYGATDFKFRCRSYLNPHEATIDLHPPGGLTKGDWGSWSSSCNANSAVCGVESKIEISSSLDKTGLNVVRFKCCSY
ncbi:DgyrCDS3805 [Dimorphilus gyrociliatus]|uniref:DgyrCDS3805 n=1 Tax=Dimorphilus gyrociliatus TaxID=2664684 RepID=A0A7I8VJL6_9ANNE|nr:DgyrCDS3805 [Dimorphilus gyrociliatus]